MAVGQNASSRIDNQGRYLATMSMAVGQKYFAVPSFFWFQAEPGTRGTVEKCRRFIKNNAKRKGLTHLRMLISLVEYDIRPSDL